ncbi:MAG: hypothetical protein PWQ25_1609 [Deferribacteres bacterium]|jgi:hypothetical protein|nr:hypothetical protein [Deferribacteres bacterium]
MNDELVFYIDLGVGLSYMLKTVFCKVKILGNFTKIHNDE